MSGVYQEGVLLNQDRWPWVVIFKFSQIRLQAKIRSIRPTGSLIKQIPGLKVSVSFVSIAFEDVVMRNWTIGISYSEESSDDFITEQIHCAVRMSYFTDHVLTCFAQLYTAVPELDLDVNGFSRTVVSVVNVVS